MVKFTEQVVNLYLNDIGLSDQVHSLIAAAPRVKLDFEYAMLNSLIEHQLYDVKAGWLLEGTPDYIDVDIRIRVMVKR